jgi:hypothetical protein
MEGIRFVPPIENTLAMQCARQQQWFPNNRSPSQHPLFGRSLSLTHGDSYNGVFYNFRFQFWVCLYRPRFLVRLLGHGTRCAWPSGSPFQPTLFRGIIIDDIEHLLALHATTWRLEACITVTKRNTSNIEEPTTHREISSDRRQESNNGR